MDSDQENQATTASEDSPSSNNSESSVDTQEDFSKYSVDELKSKLKEAGLPVSGKKADLIERLNSSESDETAKESNSDEDVSNEGSEETVANPVLSLEELEQLSRTDRIGGKTKYGATRILKGVRDLIYITMITRLKGNFLANLYANFMVYLHYDQGRDTYRIASKIGLE